MTGKRRFGRVRRLPSGRWQARYKGPDGIDRPAANTFASKTEAERWLALTEAEIVRGDWIDPDAGRMPFIDYARSWVAERPNLRPKTVQLYEGLVRNSSTAHWSLDRPNQRQVSESCPCRHSCCPRSQPTWSDSRHLTTTAWSLSARRMGRSGVATSPESGGFTRVWRRATESAGLTGFHFHDLRHTGNHIAAATGASLRELMGRMGHSTTRAALIYQHRTTERDRLIAAAMSEIVQSELGEITGSSGM